MLSLFERFMRRRWAGCLLATMSSLCFSIMDGLAQTLIRKGIDSSQIVFLRMAITLPMVITYLALFDRAGFRQLDVQSRSPSLDAESRPLLGTNDDAKAAHKRATLHARLMWVRATNGAVAILTSYASFAYLELSEFLAVLNTRIFPVALWSWLFLGEKFGWRMGTAAIISTVAVMFLVQPPFLFGETSRSAVLPHDFTSRLIGFGLCFTCLFIMSIDMTIMRFMGRGMSPVPAMLSSGTVTMVAAAIAIAAMGIQWVPLNDVVTWLQAIALAIVAFISPSCLMLSLRVESTARVSMMGYLQVVFALLIQMIFMGDPTSWVKVAAMVVIIAAGLWPILSTPPPKADPVEQVTATIAGSSEITQASL